MIEQEFSEVATQIVKEIGEVTPDEEVLLVTDAQKIHIARALAAASRSLGASTTIAVKPRLRTHGSELPRPVANAMLGADIVFGVNTHAISHTDARRKAYDEGVRFVILRGVTDDILIEQMNTDYDELNRVTRAVGAIQTAADEAHVTSPQGTDVEMDISGRTALVLDADMATNRLVAIPVGKSAVTPNEGTTNGTIVVDYSFDSIGTLDEPIELTVTDGRVVGVDGGAQADELKRLLDEHDENATNIAEAVSIGTNKDVKLIGNQAVDKKKRGTCHFAIGDNITLGGSVESDLHLDATLRTPTVRFDGEKILDEGTFLTDRILELADELGE